MDGVRTIGEPSPIRVTMHVEELWRLTAAAESYQEKREELQRALPEHCWVEDFGDDYVIYGQDNKCFRVSYSILDGKITFGEKTEVERQTYYAPIQAQAACRITCAAAEKGSDDYGWKWHVQIIEAGPDKQGRFDYPLDVIHAAAPLYENAPVFALQEAQHASGQHPFGKPTRDIVAGLKDVQPNVKGAAGVLTILRSAAWFRDMVTSAFEEGMLAKEGKRDLIALSHDVQGLTLKAAGKGPRKVTQIVKVDGVDVVYDPIGGGKFLRMAAAYGPADEKEETMWKQLLAALKAQRPDLAGKIDALLAKGDDVTEGEISALMAAAMAGQQTVDIEKLVAAMQTGQQASTEALQKMQLTACGLTLQAELQASKLPELSVAKLRKQFEGKVFEQEQLTAAIKDEKEYVDQLLASGRPTGVGDVRDFVGEPDRLQAAMDKTFGVKTDARFDDLQPFEGLRAAYVRLTGDTEVTGQIPRARLTAAFDSTTFTYALGNTLQRRLVQDYREASDYGVSRVISTKRNAKDFRTIEAVRVGYFGDLPDVNPEAADYADLGNLSDEEVSYALNQKGGVIKISRRMIINDDMALVQKIVSRLPRAARRTRAKRIWNKFINNATYKGDSKAVFHADHGNLGSTAYGITSALAAKTAMAQQTEPGSSERLMLRPVTVVHPSELYSIVRNVNEFNPQAVEIANGNSMLGFFKPEGMIELPFMTDATDWMMFADPAEVEIIEIAFLNGQEEPQMFVADNPAVGTVFTGDQIQYKIRMEDECEIVDYRGAYKAVVAG